ncbi:MAG: zinc ribbon domain-containing protein [Candidatus Omnitrophica bacterium]|nr:zinc ribbon domain-containing protein [Candidatus Omnitrophota bacterium]
MVCKNCKANIPDTARFCPKCGEKAEITENLRDFVLCPKCGTANPPTAKFCKQDGTPLQKVSAPKEETKTEVAPVIKAEEKPKDIICPKCGAPNLLTAKFCKKDGAPLQGEHPETTQKIEPISEQAKLETTIEPKDIGTKPIEKEIKLEPIIEPKVKMPPEVKAEGIKTEVEKPKIEREIKPKELVSVPLTKVKPNPEVKKEVEKKPSKAWIWVTVGVLVFVAAGVGGYLYLSKPVEKKPTEITVKPVEPEYPTPPESQITEEAANSPEEIPEKTEPTAKELSRPSETKTVSPPAVTETSKPFVDIVRVERDLSRSLRNRGLNDVYAKVNKDLTVILGGTVHDPGDKMLASTIAESFKEIKNVKNEIMVAKLPPPVQPAPVPEAPAPAPPPISKVDPSKLEGDINRAMRNAGLKGVTAEVNDNLEVTLKGTVGSNYEKDRAFEIAKTFKAVKRIRDIIFVVE